MKRILGILALFFVGSSVTWGAACLSGAATCGPATRYDVNVQEVALCQDAACASSYVVGSGVKTFDIASASIGSAIGSYANIDAIPVGIYTYVQVILDRNLTISGPAIAVGGDNCAQQTDAHLTIPNNAPDALALANLPGVSWYDGTKTKVKILMALPTPIAISKSGTRPSVTVNFGTANGLLCTGNTPYPAPPDVTISVN